MVLEDQNISLHQMDLGLIVFGSSRHPLTELWQNYMGNYGRNPFPVYISQKVNEFPVASQSACTCVQMWGVGEGGAPVSMLQLTLLLHATSIPQACERSITSGTQPPDLTLRACVTNA